MGTFGVWGLCGRRSLSLIVGNHSARDVADKQFTKVALGGDTPGHE